MPRRRHPPPLNRTWPNGTFNRKYAVMWPVIVTKKDPLPGYEDRDGEKDKRDKYFSEAPGTGG